MLKYQSVIFDFMILSLFALCLSLNEKFVKGSTSMLLLEKSECAIIPFAIVRPDFQMEAKRCTEPNTNIGKAMNDLLTNRLNKTTIGVQSLVQLRDHRRNVGILNERLEISPAHSGGLRSSDIVWHWELSGRISQVELFDKASPPFARFQIDIRLTIETKDPAVANRFIEVVSRPRRWFFIVAGVGRGQQGNVAPSNAPVCPCGCSDGPICACDAGQLPRENKRSRKEKGSGIVVRHKKKIRKDCHNSARRRYLGDTSHFGCIPPSVCGFCKYRRRRQP